MSEELATGKKRGRFELTMPIMLRIAGGVAISMLVLELVLRHGDGILLVAFASAVIIVVIQTWALGAPLPGGTRQALVAVSIIALVFFSGFSILFTFPVIHYWRNDLGVLGNAAAWALVAAPTSTISGVVFGAAIGLAQMPAIPRKMGWWILASVLGSVLDGLVVGGLYWTVYSSDSTGGPPARFDPRATGLIAVLALVAATGLFRGILTTLVLVRARKEQAEMTVVATEAS